MEFDRTAAERFVGDYFRQGTSALRQRLEVHHRYWRRFYDDHCRHDSRRGVIEKSEAEQIESVSASPTGASVITTGETIYRSRYDIRPNCESWSIHEVDMECGLCRVKGASGECVQCGGSGWLSWKKLGSLHGLPRAQTGSDNEAESIADAPHGPSIEQFMAEHFRERTLAQRKELEILADLSRRFCSSDFDYSGWGPWVKGGESERILNMQRSGIEVHVITSGSNRLRLRYHLRHTGDGWRIREVDSECLRCHSEGPSPTCFLCGGTIWENRLLNKPPDGRGAEDEPPSDAPR
jgi:hypothetical protein